MSDTELRAARMVSVFAATLIALACGTNVLCLLCMGPGFRFYDEALVNSKQPNREFGPKKYGHQADISQGTCANLGMYTAGIPVGLLVDAKGPRPGVLFGALSMGTGYYLLHRAYEGGPDSIQLPWLCFFALITGVGGAAAFAGAIKTSALNYPSHRGTATAFPLAAFGLSAFFFATISSIAFEDETAHFLLLLAVGTFAMCFVGFFFLRVIPTSPSYFALSPRADRGRSQSTPLTRSKSDESKRSSGRLSQELGRRPMVTLENASIRAESLDDSGERRKAPEVHNVDTDETLSLISQSSSSTHGDILFRGEDDKTATVNHSHHVDIRGLGMLPTIEFWQLFSLLGLLAGIGLMTINNVGNDATALWKHYDDSASSAFIQKQQLINVSAISISSFCGRLLSGVGSDLIVRKLQMSRFWCLFVSSVTFCIGQICGASIANPHMLVFVSSLTGLAYGFLFGVFPSIVAETFGINGLSTNWGFMTFSPVVSGNVFNILYGRIFDSHSIILPDGRRECPDSVSCYRAAYWVTFGASLAAVLVTLWSIRYAHMSRAKTGRFNRDKGFGREA